MLVDVMMNTKDPRTEVLAASGIMNYYLAAEIGQLLQFMMQPPVASTVHITEEMKRDLGL